MKIFWLLFMLSSPNTPIGVYENQSRCIEEGKQLQPVLKVKYSCEPATEAVLRYYAGEILGDSIWSRIIKRREKENEKIH